MSLLHPTLLLGLGLVALPLVLHLLLRQKPKKLMFPALRLIQQRRKQNVQRLKLRHLWLLLARMAVIALVVLAIARPSVPAADYSLNVREWLTLLGVLAAAWLSYRGILSTWKSKAWPGHELRHRRARLRGWVAAAALLALVLAVGWPYQRRVVAALKSPAAPADVELPVAGVFLFDTSLSMEYRQAGRTRLDLARELALAHLSEFPNGSRVAVADTSSDHPILFQSTLGNAKARMEAMEISPLSLSLNDRILTGLRLHEDDRKRTLAEQGSQPESQRRDRFLRRLYVFTDLAKSAWRTAGSSRLLAELERLPSANLFLVDVGERDRQNLAVTSVDLSRAQLPAGGELTVSATVAGEGVATEECVAELYLADGRDQPIKVAQQAFSPPSTGSVRLDFEPLRLGSGPLVHGEVRLAASDPLSFDDVRHFTVSLQDAAEVLLVAPREDDVFEWRGALELAGYRTRFLTPGQLTPESLAQTGSVCLINVAGLPDDVWYRLGQFVQHGGGLGLFLGATDIQSFNYNRPEPQVFLPGSLLAYTARAVNNPYFLSIEKREHPIFRRLDADSGLASLEATDIYRFWKVQALDEANVLAIYSDDSQSAALLVRPHGQGRVAMLTTAVDMQGYRSDWNYLANPQGDVWPFLVLADQLMQYLSGQSDLRWNYLVGETPVVQIPPTDQERRYLVQQPEFRQSRLLLPAGKSEMAVDGVDALGQYDIRQEDAPARAVAGFSVNAAPEESDFSTITVDELNDLLGVDRYQIVRSLSELKEEINIADLGRELFPLLLALTIVLFLGEHLIANRFYAEETLPGWVESTRTP